MSTLAICTDSSSLLSRVAAARLGVHAIPVAVTVDDTPFDEDAAGVDEFYAWLRAGAVATTSQPNPQAFAAAYERAASEGAESVVSIHLDARVSGTIASAEIAARKAPIPVVVVDTRTVSFGVAVCVRAAAVVATGGGSARDVAEAAARVGETIENVFVARTSPGGRVPTAEDWAVLRLADGATSIVCVCTSLDEAVARMTARAARGERIAAAVGYAGCEMEAQADQLAHELLRAESVTGVERYRVGAPVGAHTGPESFGLFWWPAA